MLHSRKVIALVPIKGHSEKVLKKNFREFGGKPLYQNILGELEKTFAIDEIVINTDSELVAKEAPILFNKVRIVPRPRELQGDAVSVNRLIEHDLGLSGGDIYVQTHATNPLLKAETIARALKLFIEKEEVNEADSLFSVTKYKSRFYNHLGEPINHNPDELLRTDELFSVNEENSCLYIFTSDSFQKCGRRIGFNAICFETPRVESIDIEDDFSYKLAELLSLYSHVS